MAPVGDPGGAPLLPGAFGPLGASDGAAGAAADLVSSSSRARTRCDVAQWDAKDVRAWLAAVLPGHLCAAARLGHASGRVLGSLSKEDLRRQAKDEEAANVIWVELRRLRGRQAELERIRAAQGSAPRAVHIRTPAGLCLELQALATDTVGQLKARLAEVEGTPPEAQRLLFNGAPLPDARTLAGCGLAGGAVLLLVPKLGVGGQRYATPANGAGSPRGASTAGAGAGSARRRFGGPAAAAAASGLPRPQVPIACVDIARPFPMFLEFPGISEYQDFMLSIQRQARRCDTSTSSSPGAGAAGSAAPFLEVLPADSLHPPVQTRVVFDTEAEVLVIDSLGDVLMEAARYQVLLHLRTEQKRAVLVTGVRPERW